MTELLDGVLAAVRETGDWLAEKHHSEPLPAAGRAEAFAAFAAIDEPAAGLLRDRLTALRPEVGWLDAELAGAVPDSGDWWVCDATDGAVQYLLGQPHWAVTATLLRDGEAVLAVVHAPQLGFSYTALRGSGAWLNGRPITPSAREPAAAVVATSQPPAVREDPWALHRAGASLSAVLAGGVVAVRNLGPTALQVAQVGSGHLDAFWEFGLDGPNLLPGALIAAEAGALVTDERGAPWRASSTGFVAAGPVVHQVLVGLLN
ncbi:myo-inositol-1(or 4)-monophosphatase [Kitasatospora sp. GP30]|uniref:inositol monophosphatase family protein n=1 Tax=Kitasatospora sp. GP30 TaxID=3035084 RepID=UPI000C707E9B|nr:inositol monophosphatase family protein [Kitasatospora sp. GP30]MDH6138941.1 myo-inositol-1(or 4)-monophosphatase [Kitasatospora sp. GP30]